MNKVNSEDTLLRDVSDLMEIQEDSSLWNSNDPSHSVNKHVTLLLFRDGDHLNLLRVIDRGEITSPISGAIRFTIFFLILKSLRINLIST
jgi:hypothetical protein